MTPSAHPEAPDIQFVSPGRGVDIRQSIDWERVCDTAQSGIWVLQGDARARKLPANLDHLRVRWSHGTTVCVRVRMDMEQQSDHKLMAPSRMELLVCGAGSHSSCLTGVQDGMCQRE